MYDIRDNKPYTVRKLADGNCWMTEDLALELVAGVPVEASLNTSATPYSFTPTSCATNGICSMNGNTVYNSSTGAYYYNWYAATAETGTSSQTNTDTPASICPVGWRIPANYTIDANKSYGALTNAYNFTVNGANNTQNHVAELESIPLSFSRLGYYYNAVYYANVAANSYNTGGTRWSSTASGDTNTAYSFIYGYTSLNYTYPQDNISRKGPNSVQIRCVAL